LSNNDFDGPWFGPEGERGADGQGAGANGTGGQGTGSDGHGAESGGRYPAPEGWGNDGFWRDPSMDSDYETGRQDPVRGPGGGGHHDDPGYSYWSDDRGWQNSTPSATPWPGPGPASDPFGPAAGGDPTGSYRSPVPPGDPAGGYRGPGAGGDQTGGYGAPAGAPGGFGGFAAPGYGAPGGYGPGSAAGPGGPGGPGGPTGPGGPAGPGRHGAPQGGGRRKGSWWRHWSWKKALAVSGGLVLILVLCLFGVYEYLSSSATIPTALASANYQNTTVYYSDGKTVIGTIGTVNRQDLTFGEIPKGMQDAVIAAEDRSFWTEGGISPTGILRAAYDDVSSSGGGSLSGGSTITQEFVRGYYNGIGANQTISRKVKEIFVAQKLTKTKSKQWILTNYLNLIYLGKNSYGVEAAAQTYFGKPVSQLTVAQDAVIAAIIQQPSYYPLPAYRTDLVARWHYVLNGMVTTGDLTQAQADSAVFPKLQTDTSSSSASGTSLTTSDNSPWTSYIMNQVYNELTAKGTGADNVSPQQLETGGLKVVTTISRPMEVEMYKAVNENINAVKETPGAEYPSYIRVGAELQNPSNGQIVAMYPGPGTNMTPAHCKEWDCSLNTAAYTREQVGSSFKPYVLSAAVSEGMNVQTSTLNANTYLCVPPDGDSALLSKTMSYLPSGNICPDLPGYFPVENDGGEVIGNPKKGGGTNVQNALAQSSNTAFTDLAHRVTTSNIIKMAQNYGVNIDEYKNGGSNLDSMVGDVGLALGTASLTVNEQTTMLSTIDNNGVYHQSHIVKYWQSPDGPEQTAAVASHEVLDPSNPANNAQLDSQVQYAMQMTTVDGTGTAAAYGLGGRPIIAKTGTTSGSTSGFFIGAIPQYSLVVGMFVANPANTSESLVPLTGGGFGGYWPAKIWNTFAQAEFANLPTENFQSPVFSGAAWNQIGKLPKAKPTVNCVENGKKVKVNGKTCPTPTPSPTPTPACSYQGQMNCTTGGNGANPTPTCSYSGENSVDGCSTGTDPAGPTPTCSFQGENNCSSSGTGTAAPTAAPTCSYQGESNCSSSGTGNGGGGGLNPASTAATANAAQAGFAVGGPLAVLPGSLLWATMSRRRRKRRAGPPR
jgi:membrane peptidoglycan carboxypeptidase